MASSCIAQLAILSFGKHDESTKHLFLYRESRFTIVGWLVFDRGRSADLTLVGVPVIGIANPACFKADDLPLPGAISVVDTGIAELAADFLLISLHCHIGA